ncbi:MAG: hypothetical protein HY526_13850 [Betaproteobacteria bacterium]|nr:hypothetical protein [Betaproteobacteria bacterium]
MGTIRRRGKGKTRGARSEPGIVRDPGCVVEVSAGQQRCLIEDLAYFRAARFRVVGPGRCRERDRREAKAEIRAVLKRRKKR